MDVKNRDLTPIRIDMTVAQLLAALASPDPTPGGGTAAAIAGAMGTSLLVMVAGLAKSKNNTDDEKAALANARAAIEPITVEADRSRRRRHRGIRCGDGRLSVAEGDRRGKGGAHAGDSIGAARRHRGPARDAACLRDGAADARVVADYGNRSAESDVGVAIGLLKAAAAGAAANVRINLAGLKDEGFKTAPRRKRRAYWQPAALPNSRVDVAGSNVQSRWNTPGTSTTVSV